MKKRKGIPGRLDTVTAQIIKLRDSYQCQRCGGLPQPQGCHWAHIFGRSDYRISWDLANSVCLCYGCHSWGHSNPTAFRDWFASKWPIRLKYLEEIRLRPQKTIRKSELKELLIKQRQKLKELIDEQ